MDNISSKSQKRQRLITLQYTCTLKSNIYHSTKREPLPFFHLDTNPVLGHILIHSVGKTHVPVVTVELIQLLLLNIISFDFVPTRKKFVRLKRFRKSYVNRINVVLTNPISYTEEQLLFCQMCATLFNVITFLFFATICPQYLCICVTYFC